MSDPAISALAYALYDSEHTTRLGEQSDAVVENCHKRAKDLLYAIREFQVGNARAAIAAAILEPKA